METISLYQVSLLASFAAGMVALFAPCCISFLLPSYFGNIFKERKKVLLMTFIYSLGIFTVMLPIVLGAKALSLFFFRFHDQSYLVGGVFMLLVAVMTFLGIKMPMPRISMNQKSGQLDAGSTYMLGVFSGVTSACCAPVLLGVMSLSAFSSSLLGSLGVGLTYVLGMVFPLYIASFFLEKGNILEKPILRKKLWELELAGRKYAVFMSNAVGAGVFALMGLITIYLSLSGGLGMPEADSGFVTFMTDLANKITEWGGKIPGLDFVFAVVMVVILWKLIERATKGGRSEK